MYQTALTTIALSILPLAPTSGLENRLILVEAQAIHDVKEERGLNFQSINRGVRSGHSGRKNYVISDSKDWESLWNVTTADPYTKPTLPIVDLVNEMVIAVYLGEKPTGGYGIEITRVLDIGTYIEVHVEEYFPQPDSIVTTALTHPFHIIKIPKTTKEVKFIHTVPAPSSSEKK